MLKRLALLLSLVAALGVGGTALASSASAASCVITQTQIRWVGELAWSANAHCTYDVDKMEFSNGLGSNGLGDGTVAIHDITWGTNILASGPAGVFYTDTYGQAGSAQYSTLGYCGGVNHGIQTFLNYRVHNDQTIPGTWGPWHYQFSTGYNITC